jgi:hypothetical protein
MSSPNHGALRYGKRQGGFAMLAIISLIVMVSAYLLVKQLNASVGFAAEKRNRNAQVLNQAKQALIGYVAQRALLASENNPGRLPCPEAVNSIGTSSEGIAAPFPGPPLTSTCAMVGRLPWRTLGLDKLLDAATEPLWYVVSPGWTLQDSSTLLSINSSTQGQLVVDGLPAPNEVVALIIAPGQAMTVQAAAGCTARVQSRIAPSPAIDPRDYIECFNSATSTFSTMGPSTSFNDQVLRVTTADLLPGIEAAIAERIKREIVPVLRNVYADPAWGSGISATNPLFPYPAPFGDPSTSNFQGASGVSQGLLPFNQTQGCDPLADARCTTTLTAWASGTPPDVTKIGGWGWFQTKNCTWQSGGDVALCEGEYHEDTSEPWRPGMIISMTATIQNVAMGLRAFDATKATIEAENDAVGVGAPLQTVPVNITRTMNSNGSVTITFSGQLPNIDDMGWGGYALYRIRLERSVIKDHVLLDKDNATTGWFVRNQWYRIGYYAVTAGYTAAALPGTSCGTCLPLTGVTQNSARAILILMGRRLTGPPNSSNRADYLEFGNADGNTAFEQRTISRAAGAPFNDRVVVLDAN